MIRYIRNFFRRFRYKIKFFYRMRNCKINYFVSSEVSNNELTELMNFYGSDKGGNGKIHNFSDYYSSIFYFKKNQIKNLLEVGLGTNNINLTSNMGADGKPLASLRAWQDYFKNAAIYGADIDKTILKNEGRIQTFFVDQTDKFSIELMFQNIGNVLFDIIIDDGLHKFEANINLFENSFKFLSKEGIYIIEDVYSKDKEKFLNYFKKNNYNFSIVDIFHPNNISNNSIVKIYNQ